MAQILITSGPTRQHLDPVRYLSNASSGRMGKALAEAVIAAGRQPVVVSGPVGVRYPRQAEVISVVSTEEMLAACLKVFPACDGLIAAAAPCDYRPKNVAARKIRKTGGRWKSNWWRRPTSSPSWARSAKASGWSPSPWRPKTGISAAMRKLEQKNCDWIVVNGPEAICAARTRVEVLDADGTVLAALSGSKRRVAQGLLDLVGRCCAAR